MEMVKEKKAAKQVGKKANVYENVTRQFDKASDLMKLDPDIRKILSTTTNEIVVHFPVKMDSGRVEMFTGYRVQHNNALGPFKGSGSTRTWTSTRSGLLRRG
jgi:glutamate dehydrogenase (NAD(P)+)